MPSFTLTTQPGPHAPRPGRLAAVHNLWDELRHREPRLALFAAVLLALLVPMALAYGLDERTLRGVNVWVKPMKFALSIAVLAATTAWFVGHLQPAQRQGRAVSRITWLLIGTGSFELAYITLQAALGVGSHYNVGSALHGAMYTLMGLGALGLTVTQPMLAWQLHRHAEPSRPAVYRRAVQTGLVLTFALGAGVGMLLSAVQPPDAAAGQSLPFVGWSFAGGDLRPAHFIGIHAQQLLPLAGLALAHAAVARPQRWLAGVTLAYLAWFAAAVAVGLPR
jgi:hypothetical protein